MFRDWYSILITQDTRCIMVFPALLLGRWYLFIGKQSKVLCLPRANGLSTSTCLQPDPAYFYPDPAYCVLGSAPGVSMFCSSRRQHSIVVILWLRVFIVASTFTLCNNNGLHFLSLFYALNVYSKHLQWSIHTLVSEAASSRRQHPHFPHSHTNGGNHQPREALQGSVPFVE